MDRERKISSVTVWGAVSNLVLSALKLLAGLFGHSSAMVADAVHSISDLISDLVVLVMVKLSSRETDKGHDYGHGKYETLATLAVSLLLMAAGARLMQSAIVKIRTVLSGGVLESPGIIALLAALISIVVKEVLYRWTASVGKKVDSPVMIANAWHHRSDALSSVGSALGIGAAILFGGKWTVLDPLVGCIISLVILAVAVKMAVPALSELTEASLPEEIESNIIRIMESVPGAGNAHALKTRRSGPNIIIEAHIVVNPDMKVRDAHEISSKVEKALRDEYGKGTQIAIHIEPDADSD